MKYASRVKSAGYSRIQTWCTVKWDWPFWDEPDNNVKSELLDFATTIDPLLNRDDIKTRIEFRTLNLFCETLDVVREIEQLLSKWIVDIYGPETDEEYEFLMKNGHKKILCDSLPHVSYKYKVFLNNKLSLDKRQQFVSWKNKYGDDIHYGGDTHRWFCDIKLYRPCKPFIYVKNSKVLAMISLYLSDNIKKIEEYILRDEVLPLEVV